MSPPAPVVYLEDLEAPTNSQSTDRGANASTTEKEATVAASTAVAVVEKKNAAAVTKTAVKRQATLTDMFSGSGGSQPDAKRARRDKSGPSASTAASGGPRTLNAIPFSLTAYVASLSDDEKRLLALECDTMGKSWLKTLKDEIRKPYFINLKEFLWKEGVQGPDEVPKTLKIYPAPQNIYSWTNLTPLGRVKVVIIGQDPYHGPNQAHGLCFSVPQGVPVPPSLRNIYKEIKNEYSEFDPPKHGNLTAWAQNGVLLLNTCLTVKAGDAGSHQKHGWEEFTDRVVDIVDKYGGANLAANGSSLAGRGRGIVFLAWGAWAAKRVAKLDKKKHLVLTSAHPSPLSASRGFLGNGHFKKANEWLEEKYGPGGCVDWCTL